LLLAALVAAAAAAHARDKPRDYPRKPVRIVVGIAPGGGLDTMCRLGAQKLSERWGRSVIVDNRPGGGTVVGMDLVSHAQPDGYTLLGASNTLMLNGALSYGSQGLGTTGHVGWERFKLTAGVDILHVPYKGAAPAVIDTVSGQIQMTFSNTVTSGAHIKSGGLRGLAITSL
jgi:tripartite-type tricarboxylate transporter receptor subunit TctC